MSKIRCIRYHGIATALNEEKDNRTDVVQLRCKQWDCDYCAFHNAQQWRAAILHAINNELKDQSWSFWTITIHGNIHRLSSPTTRYNISAKIIQENWHKLMKRVRRKWKHKLHYVRVLESHEDGTLHIHLLINIYLEDEIKKYDEDGNYMYSYTAWHKRNVVECGFGYIMDTRNIGGDNYHAGAVASYVTKYITKDLAEYDQIRKDLRVRKIQTSRSIKRVNLDSDRVWSLGAALYLESIDPNREYFDITRGKLITLDEFDERGMYPEMHEE